jgi:hypothetical protein
LIDVIGDAVVVAVVTPRGPAHRQHASNRRNADGSCDAHVTAKKHIGALVVTKCNSVRKREEGWG